MRPVTAFSAPGIPGLGKKSPWKNRSWGSAPWRRKLATPHLWTSLPRGPRARPEVPGAYKTTERTQLQDRRQWLLVAVGLSSCVRALSLFWDPRERRLRRQVAIRGSRRRQPPCIPLWFGGEKEPGLGVQGLTWVRGLALLLPRFALSQPLAQPQFSVLGNRHHSPCSSFHRWWFLSTEGPLVPPEESAVGPRVPGAVFRIPESDQSTVRRAGLYHCGAKAGFVIYFLSGI